MRHLSTLLLTAILAQSATGQCQVASLDVPGSNLFADSAAIAGDWAFIGGINAGFPPQEVFIFERTGGQWTWRQTLDEPAASIGEFGRSVASNGDWLWVSAPAPSSNANRIFAYERSGSTWSLAQTIIVNVATPNIGAIMAMDGNLAAIGMPSANRVRTYELSGGTWSAAGNLFNPGLFGNGFATALDVGDDWLAVGLPLAAHPDGTSFAGRAVAYQRVGGSWSSPMSLIPAVPEPGGQYGSVVAISNDHAILGSDVTVGQPAVQEHIHAFRWQGGSWSEEPRIQPQMIANSALLVGDFGAALDLDGDRLVVTSPNGMGVTTGTGAAWLFEYSSGWEQRARFFDEAGVAFEEFGLKIALSGDFVLTTADSLVRPGTIHEIGFGENYTYCVPAPSSYSPTGALMEWFGSLSASANNLQLRIFQAPPTPKVFLYGLTANQLPLGNGFLCTGPPAVRLGPPQTDSFLNLDLGNIPGPGSGLPGDRLYFQVWYRDEPAGGSGFNLSNGLVLEFCP